jgi:hypothetical protein
MSRQIEREIANSREQLDDALVQLQEELTKITIEMKTGMLTHRALNTWTGGESARLTALVGKHLLTYITYSEAQAMMGEQ